MSVENRAKITISLSAISKSLSHGDIEKILGVDSGSGWSIGDSYTKQSGLSSTRTFTKWALIQHGNDINTIEAIADNLFTKIREIKDELLTLPEEVQVEFSIWFDWYPGEKAFGVHFEHHQLKLLTDINASIDIDTSVIVQQ